MKSKAILGSLSAMLAFSCATATNPAADYNVKVILTPDEDGMQLYMTDYDSGAKIDSAIVENGTATMSGNIEKPVYARLLLDGERIGDFFLAATDITVDPVNRKIDSEGKLNNDLKSFNDRLSGLIAAYRALPADSTADTQRAAIESKFNAVTDSVLTANADNALGLLMLTQQLQGLDLDEFDKTLAKYPVFKDSKRLASIRKNLVTKQETSAGHQYKDFAITNDGVTQRLSDYVGNGHYTLVDFWASWCGPCIRETKVIKEIYNKYQGKGLEVLGVAVWDEPANTLRAIEEHQLPWKQIINAQTVPTDLYGISGIPCIILIDPNGKIVSRDKQDEELIADVEAAMEAFAASNRAATETKSDAKAE